MNLKAVMLPSITRKKHPSNIPMDHSLKVQLETEK